MDNLTLSKDCGACTERREYTTISKKNKTNVVVGTCEINCVKKKEGTEQWNENILNETNSISNTCSVKY